MLIVKGLSMVGTATSALLLQVYSVNQGFPIIFIVFGLALIALIPLVLLMPERPTGGPGGPYRPVGGTS